MCKECELGEIEGIDRLIEWFGERPCFHDAEVTAIQLVRYRPSQIYVHAWNTHWDKVQPDGHYFEDRHAVIDFCFQQVTDLSLAEFSQNVLSGLRVERADDHYRLILQPCYGISGFIEGKSLSVTRKARRLVVSESV